MFKYLTNAISSAIGFSKTESRGTLVLIFIILIALVSSRARISYLRNQPVIAADSTTYEWIKKVQASYTIKEETPQNFDEASVSPSKKMDVGLPKAPTKHILKRETAKKEPIILKDLNTATAVQLQKVRGIGPAFSDRITKYRELLGGFADTTQLREVYGLKEETIHMLLKQFQIQSDVLPIDFNTDSIKVLAKHPYISYDLARVIINYRKEHGDIKSSHDLRKIKAIDDGTFLRLKPYLD